MKKLFATIGAQLAVMVSLLLFTHHAFAQAATDSASVPPVTDHEFSARFFVPFIVIAIVVIVLVYVAKKYWKDNGPQKNSRP